MWTMEGRHKRNYCKYSLCILYIYVSVYLFLAYKIIIKFINFNINFKKNQIKSDVKSLPLQMVYIAFAEECFKENDTFPDYDAIDDMITAQIREVVPPPTPAFFTWLPPKIKWEANDEMIEKSLQQIKNSILNPKLIDFVNFKYPHVDLNHFNDNYLRKFKLTASHVINKILGSVRF